MPLLKQLELIFERVRLAVARQNSPVPGASARRPVSAGHSAVPPPRGSLATDALLQASARHLLPPLGAAALAQKVRVAWNGRLRTCAGRADSSRCLISLNPRLLDHGAAEVDRTLRHELAHLLAQFRAGRRRILPHGPDWRRACRDLDIANETRCHTLPFPVTRRRRCYYYRCPRCQLEFSRVRPIRRALACLACCRKHNRGKFDARFRLLRIR